ncbi:conserved hypothetical protein [Planktothrix serta PCC 8927]|uniref:Uncharacterized protein n=1 Tax=Planktothrix serta PCC 8927 TaxID=671068 RepID=A0A7Z9DXJ9_9CYAN|nr:hypothetical protein [Planktothrix serta]VXD14665.1 conserved hypothetical protein [Planktothrix serta PCC 8927]
MMLVLILNPVDGFNILHHGLDLMTQATILAQQVDVDIVADFQRTWNHIVKTGQIWAFFIGVAAGWGIKSLLP